MPGNTSIAGHMIEELRVFVKSCVLNAQFQSRLGDKCGFELLSFNLKIRFAARNITT